MKLLITDIFGCRNTEKVRNDVIFKYGHDVMNVFAQFEKHIPHSIIIPSLMTVGSEMPELDRGCKLGSQDTTPYKVGLSISEIKSQIDRFTV